MRAGRVGLAQQVAGTRSTNASRASGSSARAVRTGRRPVPLTQSRTGSSPGRRWRYVVSQTSDRAAEARPGAPGRPPASRTASSWRRTSAEAVLPAGGVGEFAHQGVAGGGEVAGDLEGEGAAGGEAVDPVGERLRRGPGPTGGRRWRRSGRTARRGAQSAASAWAKSRRPPPAVGPACARRLVEHLGGVVVAGDVGGGPAVGEEGGDVAGAAAEVGDAGRGRARQLGDAGQEVGEGAGAVAGVAQVLLRGPRWGRGVPRWSWPPSCVWTDHPADS